MKYKYKPSFVRDVKKVVESTRTDLADAIVNIKAAKSLNEILKLKKLKGASNAYRIKVGAFRLCFYYDDDRTLILSRFLPRKEVYRYFP